MPLEGAAKPVSLQSSAGYLSLKLTQTGVQVGTPAYMAPEQFAAKRPTARTDQFSFCVALYEALYGERPFAGNSVLELMTNVLEGHVRPAAEKARVPGWIRRVLLRGLSTEPDARYPSMKALLAALEADPWARRRRLLAMTAGAAAIAGVAFAASRVGAGARTTCAGGGARFAGIWEAGAAASPRKETIRAAFAATGKSFAAQAFVATSRLLDDYVSRWTAMYRDACEATSVRGEQSAEVLDLRMACLNDRLGNVRALTDVFVGADDGVVAQAASAAGSLPTLDRCADVPALKAVVKPPEDPGTRRRVDELRGELARVKALADSGRCPLARKRGDELIAAIRPLKYHPLLAEALLEIGISTEFCSEAGALLAQAKEAYFESVAGRDDVLAARAAACAAHRLGGSLGQPASARDWLLVARASTERLSDRSIVEGILLDAEGTILEAEHDFEGFVKKDREAAEATAKTFGPDHPLAIAGLANIGDSLEVAGHYEEAEAADAKALAAVSRVLGPEHPLAAIVCANACEALNRAGQFAKARPLCLRAMDIWRVVGAESGPKSFALTELGVTLVGEGKPAEAIAPLEQAIAWRTAEHAGPEYLGRTRFALARALWSQPAQHVRALALAKQAREDFHADPKTVAEIDAWLASGGSSR
jgi:tetratricopeptide (TPR) repeat protein